MSASPQASTAVSCATPAQVAVDSDETAHLLMPLMSDVDRFGITVCGYPVEYLTVIRDREWSAVAPDRRCPHCTESDGAAP